MGDNARSAALILLMTTLMTSALLREGTLTTAECILAKFQGEHTTRKCVLHMHETFVSAENRPDSHSNFMLPARLAGLRAHGLPRYRRKRKPIPTRGFLPRPSNTSFDHDVNRVRKATGLYESLTTPHQHMQEQAAVAPHPDKGATLQ